MVDENTGKSLEMLCFIGKMFRSTILYHHVLLSGLEECDLRQLKAAIGIVICV